MVERVEHVIVHSPVHQHQCGPVETVPPSVLAATAAVAFPVGHLMMETVPRVTQRAKRESEMVVSMSSIS